MLGIDHLFLKSRTLKFMDFFSMIFCLLVDLREKLDLKHPTVCTTIKSMCISVCEVSIWSGADVETKLSNNINKFKVCKAKKLILIRRCDYFCYIADLFF